MHRDHAQYSKRAYYTRLLIWVLAIQGVYWLVFAPAIGGYRPGIELTQVSDIQVAQLESASPGDLARADFQPATLPWTGCCEPAHYAFRYTVQLDQVPASGLGLIPRVNADNAVLFVDQQMVEGVGSMTLNAPTYERLRDIWRIPPALLEEGDNSFTIVTTRASQPYTDFYGALIAPYAELERDARFRLFQFNEYYWISIAMSALLALLALVIVFRSRERQMAFWLALLLSSWAFSLLLSMIAEIPLAPQNKPLLHLFPPVLIALSWFNFANEWTRRPIVWLRNLSLAVAVVSAVAILIVFFSWPRPHYFDLSANIGEGVSMVLVVAAILRFVWHMIGTRDERIPEAAVFILLVSLLGLESLGEFVSDTPAGHLDFTFPIVILAFAMAFLSRNLHLFRSMSEFNQLLSVQLADREREIADSYAERREVERQTALLKERKRIMRDMHDGMGGRLMSLAAQLRNSDNVTAPSRAELADELLAALDELRLIVDSLDTAGDDLGMALGAFRARMEPKLVAAGIELDWQIEDSAAALSLSATSILDIYRILQEACTNMLRHSGGDRLSITLQDMEDKGAVWLSIGDNGTGVAAGENASGGHGMQNMQRRAERIGTELVTINSEDGFTVRVMIPRG